VPGHPDASHAAAQPSRGLPAGPGCDDELGIADGAFVAALAFNSDRYLELFYAVPWAGRALAPLNEGVHAVVVLKDGEKASPEELIAHCRTLIGGYKCPRSVEFRNERLPVTPVGKVRKNVLRDPYWAGQERKI
jgi:acyl-CoA synthetase (AMP-forming)/AMP-acid ligase II